MLINTRKVLELGYEKLSEGREQMMGIEENSLKVLDENADVLINMAKDIWDNPQIGLQEMHASKLISDKLEKAGFRVKRGIGEMPTAFVASWGEGKPIVGVLGEYDALPNFSQKVSPKQEPIKAGMPGHGCGHNLLGIGSLGAVLAVKEVMEKYNVRGTIRYYGCPAEETLVGKVFMAREGVFNDLDAAITWHPDYPNTVVRNTNHALNSFKLNFHGVSSHPSYYGRGRSALDAVVLTEVGINCLRDNVIQEARIHGVITNGGLQPNMLPSYAQSWYYVRAPMREQVEEIYQKVIELTKGATLMTGTTMEVEFLTGCYGYLSNDIISQAIMDSLKKIGPPQFTEEEIAFAKELESKVSRDIVEGTLRNYKMTKEELGGALCDKIIDEVGGFAKKDSAFNSSEVGDVSYIAPTGQFTTCCMPLGVALHTWQCAASCGSPIGFRGMQLAAKTMALTSLNLMMKPDMLKDAFKEFQEKTGGKKYVSPLD